jgi:hypothetical protein
MIRLSIRRKIMGIAVTLIALMATKAAGPKGSAVSA